MYAGRKICLIFHVFLADFPLSAAILDLSLTISILSSVSAAATRPSRRKQNGNSLPHVAPLQVSILLSGGLPDLVFLDRLGLGPD
jgi:hypothetical protein